MSYLQKYYDEKEKGWIGLDECLYKSEKDFLLEYILWACDCSDYLSSFKLIRDTLNHFDNSLEKGTDWKDLVSNVFNGVEGAAYLVCSIINDDFIEHGISIRTSWTTEDGKELLKDLNRIIKEIEKRK